MLAHRKVRHSIRINTLYLACILLLLSSCQGQGVVGLGTTAAPRNQTQLPELQKAEITFEAQTLAPLDEGQNLFIEFLDEVTGLALNASRVQMQAQDAQTFTLKMPVAIGSVLKYRYVRDNDPVGYEYTSLNRQVRYRLYAVDGPGVVQDTISGWKSAPLTSSMGRIQGQVAIKDSNAPVVNALVTAGGMHTLTASDGSFMLEGLPAGMHNLVVYSLDGSFQTFQQGAVVAPESTTPALVIVNPARMVNVTFIVSPPTDNLKGIPIRMVGNILPLGNTFADLRGGVSVVPSRAPLMAVLPDGRYSITLKLPTGLDLRYKYTLGDGFWNSERTENGEGRLRQVIIPANDATLEDVIDTWKTKDRAPISFTVTIPLDTPNSDTVSIQFNPFGWTEPIPMWPAGGNRWFYVLYNPFNSFSSASYRFCRNDQCGTADAVDSRGPAAPGAPFEPRGEDQNFDAQVEAWAWTEKKTDPVVVPAVAIAARDANFQAGVEFSPGYHPTWQPGIGAAFQNLRDVGANTVVLTPTWRFTHQVPPVVEPVPGKDALWTDLTGMIIQSQQKGLKVVLHPVMVYPEDPDAWWATAPRNDGWWQSWFDRYSTYVLYHADLAAQTGAQMLILGDKTLAPAFPGGVLADGSPSGVPGDAADRWRRLIADVRSRYTGKIAWFLAYSGNASPVVPEFASELDVIYAQLSAPLASTDQALQADLEGHFAGLIDGSIQKLQEKSGQAVIIGLKIPSAAGALDGCVDSNGTCLPLSALEVPVPEYPGTALDLKSQADAYSAALAVINGRSWISGFYAVGYYPPAALIDMSDSIRGKPASDVLWYWYPRLTGQVIP